MSTSNTLIISAEASEKQHPSQGGGELTSMNNLFRALQPLSGNEVRLDYSSLEDFLATVRKVAAEALSNNEPCSSNARCNDASITKRISLGDNEPVHSSVETRNTNIEMDFSCGTFLPRTVRKCQRKRKRYGLDDLVASSMIASDPYSNTLQKKRKTRQKGKRSMMIAHFSSSLELRRDGGSAEHQENDVTQNDCVSSSLTHRVDKNGVKNWAENRMKSRTTHRAKNLENSTVCQRVLDIDYKPVTGAGPTMSAAVEKDHSSKQQRYATKSQATMAQKERGGTCLCQIKLFDFLQVLPLTVAQHG